MTCRSSAPLAFSSAVSVHIVPKLHKSDVVKKTCIITIIVFFAWITAHMFHLLIYSISCQGMKYSGDL